jgi:NAD(P)H-flavin reductase
MKSEMNIFVPFEAAILEVRDLNDEVKLYSLKTKGPVRYSPGQFFMVSVFGHGEIPISVTSTPDEPLMLAIKKVGHVTGAVHKLRAGDTIGLRGPYGNGFSLDTAKGRDIVVMSGGIGLIPLRPLMQEIIRSKDDFGRLFMLYSCKRPEEVLYRDEIAGWEESGFTMIQGLRCKLPGGQVAEGGSTHNLDKVDVDFSGVTAFVSGPHHMIDLSMKELSKRGVPHEMINTTLEAHMKCGVGKCGHCYMGPKYVCTDGPVFTLHDIKSVTQP